MKSMAPKVTGLYQDSNWRYSQVKLQQFQHTHADPDKGNIGGMDITFLRSEYMKRNLKTDIPFYREMLLDMSGFSTLKGINLLLDWDKEQFFLKPFILQQNWENIEAG